MTLWLSCGDFTVLGINWKVLFSWKHITNVVPRSCQQHFNSIMWHFHFKHWKSFVYSVIWLTHEQFQSVQDPDFAEVLTDLNSRELFWLSRGQLEITVTTEGQDPRRISGFITGRKSCDSKYPCYQTHVKWKLISSVSSLHIIPASWYPKLYMQQTLRWLRMCFPMQLVCASLYVACFCHSSL